MEVINLQDIQKELVLLRKAVEEIQKRMLILADDSVLSKSDKEALVQYMNEKQQGQLISHQNVKDQLGL